MDIPEPPLETGNVCLFLGGGIISPVSDALSFLTLQHSGP